MKRKFKLNDEEVKEAEKFIKNHNCYLEHPKPKYTFSANNGIGVAVDISCECGSSKDITDYDSW
jgi:hypothetical protein